MKELTVSNMDLPNISEMEMIMKYCEVVAQAPSYAAMGGMPGVFALVMTARELGIGPMTALNGGMHLIPNVDKEGKMKGPPQIMMAARTMNMMILRSGHKIEELENVPGRITLKGTRADNGVSMTVTMTIDMAKQAFLSHDTYGKPKLWSAWFKTMDDMLWKTCLSKLARRLFADVIGNAYEPAEFEEKEAKEESAKIEKKTLKGKNTPAVAELPATETTQPTAIEYKPTLDEFVELHKLRDPTTLIHEYVKLNAKKRNSEFEPMLQYCYDNSEGFLKTFRDYEQKLNAQKAEELRRGKLIEKTDCAE